MEWKKTKDEMPVAGIIIKRWKNNAVWAGNYDGNPKDTSFVEWIQISVKEVQDEQQ